MKSVACFGGLHWDVKARLHAPLLRGTSNPVVTSRGIGGVAANVARTLARLGVPVRLVSVVGEDAGALLDIVAEEGVDVTGVHVIEGAITASYTAILGPDGSLEAGIADMEVYDAMDRAWGLHRTHVGDLWFADTNVPVSGLEALRAASGGRPWFLDPVSVAKATRALPVIDGAACVFPDALEAAALTGEDDPARAVRSLVDLGADRAIATLGPDGVISATRDGLERRPASRPRSVADVTGAGDAFTAGYLAGVSLDAEDPLSWGLAAASLAVETVETVPSDLGLPALLARL